MKIGINICSIREMTGIGVFLYNFLRYFGEIDKKDEFIIFVNKKMKENFQFNFSNYKYVILPLDPNKYFLRVLFEQLIFPLYLIKYKVDILFNPSVFNPALSFSKKVTVLYDLGWPLTFSFNLKFVYLKFVTWLAKKSDKIITVSNFSKGEILDKLKIPSHKILTIYGGVPFLPSVSVEEEKNILENFKIKKPYFFFIGIITPHKNIRNILLAFKKIIEKNYNLYFVFYGFVRKELIDFQKIITDLNLKNHIIHIEKVGGKEKIVFYKNSLALIFPSTHEGFGLPVLEAQSLGVPVLTSNVTALPEVAGEGALYVDPYNVEEIAKGMERIAFDENLRKDLIKKGFENIKRFSWERAAKELLKVFKEVYESSSSS
jgi:glycosyltransferase involved in cell wall biosynthesis